MANLNSAPTRNEIVFIVGDLPDQQALLKGLSPDAEIHVLDATQDGLAQMAAIVAGRSGLEAVHLLSHGAGGALQLGTTTLSCDTLAAHAEDLATLRSSLAAGADLLLYGCNVAEGETGRAFVQALSAATGADVAASTDLTGAAGKGGDWVLESHTGNIQTNELPVSAYSGVLATQSLFSTITAPSGSPQGFTFDFGSPLDYLFSTGNSLTFTWTGGSSPVNPTTAAFTLGYDPDRNTANSSQSVSLNGAWSVFDGPADTIDFAGGTGIESRVYINDTWGISGSYMYTLTVAGNLQTDTFQLWVRIQDPNTAPVANDTTVTVAEGGSTSVSLSGLTTDAQTASGALTYSGSGVSGTNMSYTAPTDISKKGTQLGANVIYTATDPGTLSDTGTVTFNVTYADDPTTWGAAPGNQTWTASGTNNFNYGSGASDPDTADAVSYSYLSGKPAWMSVAGTTISGNAAPEFAGQVYTINVRATGSNAVDKSFTITTGSAAQLNDVPTSAGGAQTLNEDASHTFAAGQFNFADLDNSAGGSVAAGAALGSVRIDTLAGNGTLKLGGVDVTAGQVIALADIGTLVYTPSANYNGSDSFTYSVNDGIAYAAAPATLALTVSPINDAPVLVDGVPLLTTRTENENTNAGNLVSDLLNGTAGGANQGDKSGRSDVDTTTNGAGEGIAQGIAIHTAANNATAGGGTWEYSTNGGGAWTAIGAVASNSALLLRASDKVRFVPDTQNGTTASLGYYAWDGASGAFGNKVDPGARGGITAFSTASDTATIVISDVNDAPLLDLDGSAGGTGYTTNYLMRGAAVAIADSDITISDVDKIDNPHPDTLTSATVVFASVPTDNQFGTIYEIFTSGAGASIAGSLGTITVSGSGSESIGISGTGTWAEYQDIIKAITYQNTNPNAFHGDRTVTVTVKDGGITTAADDKLDSLSATTTIHSIWAPVVDANGVTAGSSHTASYTENAAAVKITTADSTITDEDSHLSQVVISISNVQDGGAETLTITGGNSANWGGLGLAVTGSGTATLTLSGNLAPSIYQLALRSIGYINSSENPSVTQRVISIVATDIDAHVGATGYSYVNVVPVNDAPVVGGDLAATLLEGGLYTLTSGDLSASDVDDAAATLDYVVTTVPTKGVVFRDSNGNGVADSGETLAVAAAAGVITRFTQGDVNAGLVKYRHDGSETIADSLVFKVEDGMENGVVAPAGTLNFTVTAVNDAPTLTATAGSPTFTEGGAAALLFSGSAAGTVEAGQNIARLKLTVSGLANGAAERLLVDGTEFALTNATSGNTVANTVAYSVAVVGSTATVTLTKTDTTANWQTIINGLAYKNTSDAPNTAARVATLTEIKDDGGTANGGADTTTLNIAATVAVAGANAAPTGLPAIAGTVSEGQTLTANTGALADTDGLGSYSYQWKANGANISGATASTYLLTSSEIGKAITVTVSYTDGGGTPETLTSNATANVADVNNAPTLAATGANPTAIDGTAALFSGAAISTVEAGQLIKKLVVTVSGLADGVDEKLKVDGVLVDLQAAGTTAIVGGTLGGVSYAVAVVGAVATVTLTHAGISEAGATTLINGLSYKNAHTGPTAGLRIATLTSVQDDGGVAGGGADTTTVSLSSSVNVGAVPGNNTVPTVSANTGFTLNEGAVKTLLTGELAATDSEQPAGGLSFVVGTAPVNGTLFRDANANGAVDSGETLAATASFAQLDLTNGLIKYRHNGGETTTDSFAFTVSDGLLVSGSATSNITINAANDAPTLAATAANPTFTEGGAAAAVFAGSVASTVEAGQNITQFKLTVSGLADGAAEKLVVDGTEFALTNGASGNAGANVVAYSVAVVGSTATVTLTHAGLTQVQIASLIDALAYRNTSDTPTGTRVVTLTQLKDSGGTANGGNDTASLSIASTVTMAGTNNAPTLAPTGFTVTEGASFTVTTTELTASDADSASSSFVYTLTGAPTKGTLYIDANGNAQVDGGEALATSGTFTHAQLTGGKIRYQHDGSESADSFAVKVGDGAAASAAQTVSVTRTAVNDAPTLANLHADALSYPANSGVKLVDVGGNAAVTDPDSADFNGGSLRVSVSLNNDGANDVLSIKNIGTGAGQIGVSGGNVSYAGTTIGTWAGGTGVNDLVITFNASSTPTAATALVGAIQFSNGQASPANPSRNIAFTLSDGDGGLSQTATVNVTIQPNNPPIIVNGTGFYIAENTTAVTIISATDPNSRPITYSVSGGADAAKFSINAGNGQLNFAAAPDYEIPGDVGGNNIYNVTVRATNDQTSYNESALVVNVVDVANEAAQAAAGDTAGPVFGFATVNGSALVMTYTDADNLDAANIPLASAFTVSGNTVTGVAVSGAAKTVTLTLGAAVAAGAAVTVAYADPTAGNDASAIQDTVGNDSASLSATAVTNLAVSAGGGGGGGGGGGTTTPTSPTPTPGSITDGTTTAKKEDTGTTTTTTGKIGTVTIVETVVVTTEGKTVRELVYVPVSNGTGGTGTPTSLPLLYEEGAGSDSNTTITLPVGVGLASVGGRTPSGESSALDLIDLIQGAVGQNDPSKGGMLGGGQSFLDQRPDGSTLWINKVVLTAPGGTAVPNTPVIIDGAANNSSSSSTGDKLEALVVDASHLPAGAVIELQNVDFAVLLGDGVVVRGGAGANVVYGGEGSQDILLGAGDDVLYGGAGDDIVGSEGGADMIFGNSGNDRLFGGAGADLLHGGSGVDMVTYGGNIGRYQITRDHGKTIVRSLDRLDDIDTLVNVENIRFDDATYTVNNDGFHPWIATLYGQVLNRQADLGGFQWWSEAVNSGLSDGEVALNFLRSTESQQKTGAEFDKLDVAAQVEYMYTEILGRPSEATGKEGWVQQYANGFSMRDIAGCFVHSVELTGQYLAAEGCEFSV